MTDTFAATLGFIAAGVAFATIFLPWPAPVEVFVGGLALLALFGLGLRRHGYLDRRRATFIAFLAGFGLLLIAIVTLREIPDTFLDIVRTGPFLALISSLFVIVFGYVDWQGATSDQVIQMTQAIAGGVLISVLGLISITIWATIILVIATSFAILDINPITSTSLSTLALGLGTGTVAVLYIYLSNRGFGFIDISWLSKRDFGYVLVGIIGILTLNITLSVLMQQFGIESARHSVLVAAEMTPEILLVLIPLSFILVAPGEELLYRNVIQKMLYDSFSRKSAVIIASCIFAAAHYSAFTGPSVDLLAAFNTLLIVFALSLMLGVSYERTKNLLVPILIHGGFNAIVFAVTYLRLMSG